MGPYCICDLILYSLLAPLILIRTLQWFPIYLWCGLQGTKEVGHFLYLKEMGHILHWDQSYRLCPLSPGTFISSHILLARGVAFFYNKAFTPKVSTWGPSNCVPPHLLDFTWCKCGQNWRILKLLLMNPWVEGLKFLNSKFYRKHIRGNAYSSCFPSSVSKSSVIRRDTAQACLLI